MVVSIFLSCIHKCNATISKCPKLLRQVVRLCITDGGGLLQKSNSNVPLLIESVQNITNMMIAI